MHTPDFGHEGQRSSRAETSSEDTTLRPKYLSDADMTSAGRRLDTALRERPLQNHDPVGPILGHMYAATKSAGGMRI